LNSEQDIQSFYIPKPPKKKEELIFVFKSILGYNFIDKFQMSSVDIINLPKFITKKTRNKNTVFLIDEAHECSIDVLEWLRTLVDMVPKMSIVFAGLPIFEKILENELTTLSMRVTTKVFLESLDYSETESLIRKRIEMVGGRGIDPFSSDSVKAIFEMTGGFPREIIKSCDKLISESARKNLSNINRDFSIENLSNKSKPVLKKVKKDLKIPTKQMSILKILSKENNLSPSGIVDLMGNDDYKTKNNAIRSVNNILRRLMKEELISRKKDGNAYVYYLTGKSKSLLAEA
jgi:type II secretory pathway predicted ATPase ExeA